MKGNYNGYAVKAYDELMAWPVKRAAWLYNPYLLHPGGQTPYERRWNRHYSRSCFEFAGTLLYRPAKQQLPKAKLQWHCGVWLGRCAQSRENYIGATAGVIATRDIKRLAGSERHQVDYLRKVAGAPWQPTSQKADYPFFVLLNPLSDVPSVLCGPLWREADGQPPIESRRD